MMLGRSLPTAALVLVTILKAHGAPQTGPNPNVLTLCELVNQAERYDHQIVSVRAYYLVGAEEAVLYDPACRNGEFLTFVDFAKLKGKFPERLRHLEKTDKRALVIFEGTFFGPEPLDVDPSLPQAIKDKLAGSKRRYGHLGSLESMLRVTRVEQVEKIPRDAPP